MFRYKILIEIEVGAPERLPETISPRGAKVVHATALTFVEIYGGTLKPGWENLLPVCYPEFS